MAIYDIDFLNLTSELDLDAFWAENEHSLQDGPDKPRCSISFSPDDHWLFEFLAIESTLKYYRDKAYRDELHAQANKLTLEYVGRTFFEEDTWSTAPRRIENLFGCEFTYIEGGTPWLTPATDDPGEFSQILDRAERTNLRAWALPEDFRCEWKNRQQEGKPLPALGTGSRGPATIMTSVLHPETFFLWTYDHSTLLSRFRDLLTEKMIELNRILRDFSGYAQKGWWITDDNSALFNRRLYQDLCVPVLNTVMAVFAPGDSPRYQHSDSAMGHLLDYQRELGINACNYGPTVDAAQIRKTLPIATIHGQMPPMLLRSGSPQEIRHRVREDFIKAGSNGKLVVTTAGSLAAGTGLGRMRWMMLCVQEETRYH
jgi:uroporphyrinogen decarboxylase